jgi:hypothetical protein
MVCDDISDKSWILGSTGDSLYNAVLYAYHGSTIYKNRMLALLHKQHSIFLYIFQYMTRLHPDKAHAHY